MSSRRRSTLSLAANGTSSASDACAGFGAAFAAAFFYSGPIMASEAYVAVEEGGAHIPRLTVRMQQLAPRSAHGEDIIPSPSSDISHMQVPYVVDVSFMFAGIWLSCS